MKGTWLKKDGQSWLLLGEGAGAVALGASRRGAKIDFGPEAPEAARDYFEKPHGFEQKSAESKEIEAALRHRAVAAAKEHARHVFGEAKAKPFEKGKSVIPPSGKVLGEEEVALMTEASLDAWLTAGRFSDHFEGKLAQRLGASRALAVNSGSSANLLALSALTSPKLGDRALVKGDEVITAAAGFPTTINPIIQNGLMPVLVDSNPNDCNIDCAQVEAAIGPRTKAIMAAHTLGNPMDMRELSRIAKKRNLWLIEDCCDALGSELDGKLCGSFGDIGTLSFYPAHHITMGEGGAVFSKNAELLRIIESFRDWGRDCYCAPGRDNTCGKRFGWKLGDLPAGYDHKYTYAHAGYNMKISDMQAACGVAQLARLDGFIKARRENREFLKKALGDLGFWDLAKIQEPIAGANPSWFGFLVTLNEDCGSDRTSFLQYLEERAIGTRLLFAGNVTRQPYFIGREHRAPFPLVNADRLMNQAFWVGIWPGLEEERLSYLASVMGEYFGLGW